MAAPLLGPIDASPWLATGLVEQVLCGGENYDGARPCHHEWVKSLSDQCRAHSVQFNFIETGTVYVKDGKPYRIPDKRTQSRQAHLSGLSVPGRPIRYNLRHPAGTLFDDPIERRTGPFLPTCATCGSRPTCNGCSHCGVCSPRVEGMAEKITGKGMPGDRDELKHPPPSERGVPPCGRDVHGE
jgi:hypothetical protein